MTQYLRLLHLNRYSSIQIFVLLALVPDFSLIFSVILLSFLIIFIIFSFELIF